MSDGGDSICVDDGDGSHGDDGDVVSVSGHLVPISGDDYGDVSCQHQLAEVEKLEGRQVLVYYYQENWGEFHPPLIGFIKGDRNHRNIGAKLGRGSERVPSICFAWKTFNGCFNTGDRIHPKLASNHHCVMLRAIWFNNEETLKGVQTKRTDKGGGE